MRRAAKPPQAEATAGEPFWSLAPDDVLAQLRSSRQGLTSADAEERLRRWGSNEVAPPPRFEVLREILRFAASPLALILFVACAASAAFGQVVSATMIALMLV